MGMFDAPQYLTGTNGFVSAGDKFWLHNARLDGTVTVQGKDRDQAKLAVSHDQNGEQVIVFTSGIGIVNQVRRMSHDDISNLPMEVRLDQAPSKQGNPTYVLSPASAPPPSTTPDGDSDIPF
jgi:hypothetical protein